ncbi:MAG: glycosyltransferase family 2 protein [Alphaproteobacteria bacterium]|nr:glycosyltransferase family 2 protein [Alphaproteobacteria bacterium]
MTIRPPDASERVQPQGRNGAPPVISIVVPAYNEGGNIRPLTEEILAAMAGGPSFEILFVDDCSDDGSPAEMEAMRAAHAEVRVVRHDRRSGKSAALFTAGRFVRGAWIQTLDGDLQNDPRDVPRAFAAATGPQAPARLGIVAGQRTSRNDGWFKWLQSRIANGVRRALLQDGTRDTGCGFKLIRAEAFRHIPYFDGMHRFLPALVRRAGFEVMALPVTDRPRGAGTSKYGFLGRLGAGIVDLFGVVWLIRRSKPPPGLSGDL